MCRAVFDFLQCLAPLLCGQRAGQQCARNAQLRKQRLHGLQMLLREQLGRRHNRRLIPVARGKKTQRCGNHGLAGADISLNQPAQRSAFGNIHTALLDGALLCAGQLKRQSAVKQPQAEILHRQSVHARTPLPELAQPAGEQKQLLKYRPAPRRLRLLHGLGAVNRTDRISDVRQSIPFPNLRRNHILHAFGQRGKRCRRRLLHIALPQSRGQRVDRHNSAAFPPGTRRFKYRSDHHRPPVFHLHSAVKQILLSGGQLARHIGLLKKTQQERSALVKHNAARQFHPAAQPGCLRRSADHGAHARLLSGRQPVNRDNRTAVLIAPRVKCQHIV